jgi:hypothetical protein
MKIGTPFAVSLNRGKAPALNGKSGGKKSQEAGLIIREGKK